METDDLLPLSGLQHVAYCERQFALIHVEQLWTENTLTILGRQLHERVDLPGQSFGAEVRMARSVSLRSERLGLIGKADVVEFHREAESSDLVLWRPFPVEYKRGRPKPWNADEVQLCAQALCLEEMLGIDVPRGALYYGTTRRRKPIEFAPALRTRTEAAAQRCHELFDARITPRIARNKRCDRCSLLALCIPDLTGDPSRSNIPLPVLLRLDDIHQRRLR
jgi:CRISPR-associated exonuclease Cas4